MCNFVIQFLFRLLLIFDPVFRLSFFCVLVFVLTVSSIVFLFSWDFQSISQSVVFIKTSASEPLVCLFRIFLVPTPYPLQQNDTLWKKHLQICISNKYTSPTHVVLMHVKVPKSLRKTGLLTSPAMQLSSQLCLFSALSLFSCTNSFIFKRICELVQNSIAWSWPQNLYPAIQP